MRSFISSLFVCFLYMVDVSAQTVSPNKGGPGLAYSRVSFSLLLQDHYVINQRNFCRNTFYTWTTKKQVEELRKDPTLLTRSKSKTRGYSEFDIVLKDTAFSKFPEAEMLSDEMFSKKRFAWPHSWATVMGWKDENYGNQLIKIVLKDDAIICKFDETNKFRPFSFYNIHGDSLSRGFVRLNRARIAAVYHIGIAKTPRSEKPRGTYRLRKVSTGETQVPFREYVIMNENMVKAWSYGTPDIIGKLDSEINMLKVLIMACETERYDYKYYLVSYTPSYFEDTGTSPSEFYYSSICFQNDLYLLNEKRITAIEKTLEKVVKAQGLPITK